MSILENMTPGERFSYEIMKKRGYSDKEAVEMAMAGRTVSPELREKAIQAIKKNLIVERHKED